MWRSVLDGVDKWVGISGFAGITLSALIAPLRALFAERAMMDRKGLKSRQSSCDDFAVDRWPCSKETQQV